MRLVILSLVLLLANVTAAFAGYVTEYPYVTSLAADKVNNKTFYAYANDYAPGDIYKTIDSGATWTNVAKFPQSGSTVTRIVTGYTAKQLYFVTDYGLYKTADDGVTWSTLLYGMKINALVIDPATPALLYAGTSAYGVLKSNDGGQSWTAVNAGLSNTDVKSLATNSANSKELFAGTGNGVFRSTDGGLTWESYSTGLAAATSVADIIMLPSGALYIASSTGVYLKYSSTTAWQAKSTKNNISSLAFTSGTATTLFGYDATKAYKSADSGGTWTSLGASDTNVTVSSPSTVLFYLKSAGFKKSTDNGTTLSTVVSGLTTHTTYVADICTVNCKPQPANYGIVIQVVSDAGVPITNAKITIASLSYSATTPGGSLVIYCGAALSGSSYSVDIQADGYVGKSVTIDSQRLETATLTQVTLAKVTDPFQIMVFSGANGTVSGSSYSGMAGDILSFTVTPSQGYDLEAISGCSGFLNGDVFTTAPLTGSCTITANFAVQTFTVTPVTSADVTFSPATAQMVNYNDTTSFTLTPAPGLRIASVTGCNGTLNGSVYTTGPITSSCNVTATLGAAIVFMAGANGTISGVTSQLVAKGGSTLAVTAVPNAGSKFVNWTSPDGFVSTSNPITIPNISASQTITANFAPQTFTVTPETTTNGSLSPATPQNTNYNTTTSFTVTPATGYQIASVTGCGGSLNGTIYTTGPVTADCSVTATFGRLISFEVGANGSLSGATNQVIPVGGSTTAVTAVPNTGYKFTGWAGAGGMLISTDNPLTLTNISVSQTVKAFFAAQTFTVTPAVVTNGTVTPATAQIVNYSATTSFTVTPATGFQIVSVNGCGGALSGNTYTTGTITADCTVTATFGSTVNFSAGSNGTIAGTTSQVVANGGNTTAVTAVPNTGYKFVNWTGTGGFVTSTANPLTITNVAAPQTITANFAIQTFAVTPAAMTNGTVTPGTAQTVAYNATTSFTVTPATGFQIVSVNGCGGALNGNIYTTGAINADCTVTATFGSTVNFSAGSNGTITGTTNQVVPTGGSTTAVTAVPNTGYKFLNWTGIGSGTSTSNPLIISTVNSPMSITANFVQEENGVCGTADRKIFNTIPAANLCSSGIPSSMIDTDPLTWTCSGANGGRTTTCTAILDTTPPTCTISTLSDGAITSLSPLNITGTCTDAHGVASVTINGNAVSVAENGSFSYALPFATEGEIPVTVVATDNAGNSSSDVRTISYLVTLPTLTITAPVDNSQTKDAAVMVTGTLSRPGGVEIRNFNTFYGGITDGTNFWSSMPIPLTTGINTLEVTVTDAAGNKSAALKRTILYDPNSPSLAITEPSHDTQVYTAAQTVSGTVSDATNTAVTLSFNGVDYPQTVTNGQFSQTLTIPAEGSYPVEVTAVDAVGNPPTTVRRNIIFTAPAGGLADALKAFQAIHGLIVLTSDELLRLDCAPLGPDGKPAPNGKVDGADAMLLLRRAVGLNL